MKGLQRVVVASLSVVMVALSLAVAPAAAAREGATSVLTVTARLCPVGYSGGDYANDCLEPLSDVLLTAYGGDGGPPAAVTDINGVATITGFAGAPFPRFVLMALDIPGEFVEQAVFCADPAGNPYEVCTTPEGYGITVDSDAQVGCSWYVTPLDLQGEPTPVPVEGAQLTIHNRLCPEGFAGPDYYGARHAQPAPAGLEFAIEGDAVFTGAIDAAGNITFDLEPGDYLVRGGVPGEFATLTVYCAPAATPGVAFPLTLLGDGVRGPDDTTGIALSLAPGDEVVCDWYNTPESQRGEPEPTAVPAPAPVPTARPGGTTPVVTLPNTGSGARSIDGALWAIVLLAVGSLAVLVVARRSTRLR